MARKDRSHRYLNHGWTVDYGDGRKPKKITVPHAWRQDVPVDWEGPAIYRVLADVPIDGAKLRFHGVSFSAEIYVGGQHRLTHRGIWDAFDLDLSDHAGRVVELEIHVTKNGGGSYPVRSVASGFLPYVFHTFGGIFREVEWTPEAVSKPKPPSRVELRGTEIRVDGKPTYLRGLLHWGWYPQLGHPNPSEATIREEVRAAKALGFNLVKFCLWVPPHAYLEILEQEGMLGWLELPLWDPEPGSIESIALELEDIVRQYRHHPSLIAWTIGCELSSATPPEYRERMVNLVQALTGCPLVKDNSGGAEMYGGDLREFGSFRDFHPYCDTPHYPPVLDSLLNGPRSQQPILLGEFNDLDVHRDLASLVDHLPYWASGLPELNAKGVRWQYDLPRVLAESDFAHEPEAAGHERLLQSSRSQALFVSKFVHEQVRARSDIRGYVVTGWRDTPISSSGFFDDWGNPRFSPEETADWNGAEILFRIPARRPPWQRGGNQPGWIDDANRFVGPQTWTIGLHSESGRRDRLIWEVVDRTGLRVSSGVGPESTVSALTATVVGEVHCVLAPGEYLLKVEFGGVSNSWPIWVVDGPSVPKVEFLDPENRFGVVGSGGPRVSVGFDPDAAVSFLTGEGTVEAPFWREAAYQFRGPDSEFKRLYEDRWERLLPISGDRVIDSEWLGQRYPDAVSLLTRVDTRTYRANPVVAVTQTGKVLTTLRPYGGLGIQPGFRQNPSGQALLGALLKLVLPD